jgi:hypothetical protein
MVKGPKSQTTTYRVDDMFVDDIATYVSLNWLEISKFPLDMMYTYGLHICKK